MAVTEVERDGRRIAALVHDPALGDEPELVASAGAAAGLALENERLQAELRARLEELRASRARIVEAAHAERRRIERDLHDGTQQRLVSVAMTLGLADSRAGARSAGRQAAARPGARPAHRRARPSCASSPRASTRRSSPSAGCAPRSRSSRTARRCRSSSTSTLGGAAARPRRGGRLLRRLRGADQRRQARARRPRVRVARAARRGRAVVEVADDGVGGADRAPRARGCAASPTASSALGGRLRVESPPGRDRRPRGDPMRVVLADDSMLLREGLARLLGEAGFDVVGRGRRRRRAARAGRASTGRTWRSSTSACRRPTPTRGCAPRRAIRERRPEVGVLVLSQYVAAQLRVRAARRPARRASATCSRTASSDIDELADGVRRVARGRVGAGPGGRRASCRAPRRDRDPLERADGSRARGARADGRGPLEPGDRRASS